MKQLYFLSLILMLSSSCAPRLLAPQTPVHEHYIYGELFSHDSLDLNHDWWELFGDTTLNQLVERALDYNRNLWIASSRIEQARQNRTAARSALLPQFGYDLSAQGNYNRTNKIVEQYAITPEASWESPLFGQLRETTKAAQAAFESAVWNYRGVELSLAAEVATTYFTLLQYERDLLIAQRTTRLRRESAALVDSMFRYGMSSGVDREQSQGLVYSSEADIPRYQSAIEQTRLALNTLTGIVPEPITAEGSGIGLLTDHYPEQLSIGLPSELLQRRPDIMQAYYALNRAAAEAGLARLKRFPSILLTAKGGIGANSTKGLLSSNPAIWGAALGFTGPIFQFQGLRSNERAAIEAYNQAAYTYEQTILEAFADVEEALSMVNANRIEVDRYTQLVVAYRSIVEMAYALYQNGLSNYLDIIDAERTLYSAQMDLVGLIAQQYINYVTLCKALGGGW